LQTLVFLAALFGGGLEVALAVALSLVIWWLAFAFIWLGTHWVRWLLGAWTLLLGFALFIWGMRDQSIIQWSVGVIDPDWRLLLCTLGALLRGPAEGEYSLV